MDTITFETEVLDVIQRTHDVKSFRFTPFRDSDLTGRLAPNKSVKSKSKAESFANKLHPDIKSGLSLTGFKTKENADFKPGQFFFVTIKINGEEKTKHFSFSNSPTEMGYLEFTKRITESDYSKALDKLKAGDWAKLRMPLGKFTPFRDLSLTGLTFEGEYPKIAFISGGIGITPIRSICKFATDKKLPADIILLYGNRTEEDIAFRDDFTEMQKINKNIRVIYTLDNASEKWEGRTGHINDDMITGEIPDFKERVFYICGPPTMVEGLVEILKDKLSVTADKIKTESFTGY